MWCHNKWNVVQNEDTQLLAFVIDADGVPFNVAGLTAIALRMWKDDDTVMELQAVNGFQSGVGHKVVYMYNFNLSAADSLLLRKGGCQTVELKLSYGLFTKFLLIPNCLTVTNPIF